jgi:hypothetical protein
MVMMKAFRPRERLVNLGDAVKVVNLEGGEECEHLGCVRHPYV